MAHVFKSQQVNRRSAVRVAGHRPAKKLQAAIKAVQEGRYTEYGSPAEIRSAIEARIVQRRSR